jgi:hypothetical protein
MPPPPPTNGSDPNSEDPFISDMTDNAYSMAYILEHIKAHNKASASDINPRQELYDYLKEDLRESGTDIVKWWAVSITFAHSLSSH